MTKAGDRILRSIESARRFARGEVNEGFILHPARDPDVGAIRARLGLSRGEFALRFGFSRAAVASWEAGRRRPTGPARTLLRVIEREPEAAQRALSGA